MGSPKSLLSWCGVSLIEYQITSLVRSGVAEVIVVLGHKHEEIQPLVYGRNVRSVLNSQYQTGKTTSIKSGIYAADQQASDFILLSVDQPRPPAVISMVLDSHSSNDALITLPRHLDHRGHPVIFSSSLRPELTSISESRKGVRAILDAHSVEVNEVSFDDPIVCLDINTPEEYEHATRINTGCNKLTQG